MPRTLLIVEVSQNRSITAQAGLWFTIQGKFDEMAPLGLIDKAVSINDAPYTIADASVRNGVLSLKLDGANTGKVTRGSKIDIP